MSHVDAATLRAQVGEHPVFSRDEFVERVDRARAAMDACDVDLVILFDSASIAYFTGFSSINVWDPSAIAIHVDGAVRVLIWDWEVPRFEVSAGLGETWTYSSPGSLLDALRNALDGLAVRTYGIDTWVGRGPADVIAAVPGILGSAREVDVLPILWHTRLKKSAAELATLRRAAELTDLGAAAGVEAVAVDATDHEICAEIARAMLNAGSEHFAIQPIVGIGARASVSHSEAGGKRVTAGEPVFLEVSGSFGRYSAPLMRTAVVGAPDHHTQELARLALKTLSVVVEEMRPGAPCSAVARAGQQIISEHEDIVFHRTFGYPVGLAFPPTWTENLAFAIDEHNDEPLEEGMVFHLPICLRHRGHRGVGFSHTVVITEQAAEPLGTTPPGLAIKTD